MRIEKPQLSPESEKYRKGLAEKLKKTRSQDEKDGKFITEIKKVFGKDGRTQAKKILEGEKQTGKYQEASEEQQKVREDFLEIKNWEELTSRFGVPSKEKLYSIISNVELLKNEAGQVLLDSNPDNEDLVFIIKNVESLRYEAGTELLKQEPSLEELWVLVEKVEELRDFAGRKIIMDNERNRRVLNDIIRNKNLDFLHKEAEEKIKILDRDDEIREMDRHHPEVRHDPQAYDKTILLTLNEIDKIKKYIDSGDSHSQSGFGRVFLSNGSSQGSVSLFIDKKSGFSGNMLEYIDEFSNEIFRNTGIRFCYLEGKHSPVSEKYGGSKKHDVWQFVLVPKST